MGLLVVDLSLVLVWEHVKVCTFVSTTVLADAGCSALRESAIR